MSRAIPRTFRDKCARRVELRRSLALTVTGPGGHPVRMAKTSFLPAVVALSLLGGCSASASFSAGGGSRAPAASSTGGGSAGERGSESRKVSPALSQGSPGSQSSAGASASDNSSDAQAKQAGTSEGDKQAKAPRKGPAIGRSAKKKDATEASGQNQDAPGQAKEPSGHDEEHPGKGKERRCDNPGKKAGHDKEKAQGEAKGHEHCED